MLLGQLETAVRNAETSEPGFDQRLLLRINFAGRAPEGLRAFPGVEVVSEEPGAISIIFATPEGRSEFENRLRLVQRGQDAVRKDVLFAMNGLDAWTPDDRTAPLLRDLLVELRAAPGRSVALDVELWPLDRPSDVAKMVERFVERAKQQAVDVRDSVRQPVAMLRIKAAIPGIEWVLRHRDVRLVDLPPRFHLDPMLQRIPLTELKIDPPTASAAPVAVLDSGIVANHPLLAPAVAHTESFLASGGPADEHGRGTFVAGIAAYGDLIAQAESHAFRATARIVSGRILDGQNEYEDDLIENQVTRAVETLVQDFGCRVFNLSLGDANHPHRGGRLRPFAMTLDLLAQKHRVLFVVSAGNYVGGDRAPLDWRQEYPRYLLSEDAHILDPAPALNVLTVGSIARYEQSPPSLRNPDHVEHQAIARRDQPSPFTRSGPAGHAIKPELVEHGGNASVNVRVPSRLSRSVTMGVLSTNHDLGGSALFRTDDGTSFAAPKIANVAARLLERYPNATAELLRALLVAHADVPDASKNLVEREELLRLVGYGVPRLERCLASSEDVVTLVAEERLGENETHFFELPLPDDFLRRGRHRRRIRIALAHTPTMRPSRADYRASRLQFRLVRETSLDVVRTTFRHKSELDNLQETGFWPGPRVRERGTVQAATWEICQVDRRWGNRQPFLVVWRIVPQWAEGLVPAEPYAVVAIVEDCSGKEVRLYTQLRARLRPRLRVRTR
jgi:hypothetical protein